MPQAARSGRFLARDFLDNHAHDVALLHDQVLDAVELDLGARPLAEQHPVTDLHVNRDELAVFVAAAGADAGDLALGGLFLRRIGNDDPAGGLLFSFDALDDDTIVKRAEFHDVLLGYWADDKILRVAVRQDPGRTAWPAFGWRPEKLQGGLGNFLALIEAECQQ